MSPGLGWLILALVFVDEALLIWAAADVGAHVGGVGLGVVAGVGMIAVWWLLASPKAPYGGPVIRPLTKVVVFTGACAGLWAVGHPVAALALGIFSAVINALAQLPPVARLVDAPPTSTRS